MSESPEFDGEPIATTDLLQTLESHVERRFENTEANWWEALDLTRAVRYGHPVEEICDYAINNTIDLIVMGTHGRSGLARILLGSVAERVVRISPCPVLIVRHPDHDYTLVED